MKKLTIYFLFYFSFPEINLLFICDTLSYHVTKTYAYRLHDTNNNHDEGNNDNNNNSSSSYSFCSNSSSSSSSSSCSSSSSSSDNNIWQ